MSVANDGDFTPGGRRRRSWTRDEKRRIVEESLEDGASIAEVARRHELNANLLFTWRRKLGVEPTERKDPMEIVPVTIAPEWPRRALPERGRPDGNRSFGRRPDRRLGRRRDGGADARSEGAVAAMISIPSGVRVWIATGHTDMRRGMQGLALQVQESSEARSPYRRSLHLPRSPRRSRQDPLARWNWTIALRQTTGPRKVHMAVGVRRRGVDLGGANGVHARRDRLAESATDVAAQERRLECAD